MKLRKLIPAHLKLQVSIFLRKFRDFHTGHQRLFATEKPDTPLFIYTIATEQPVRVSGNFENKLHNITRGAEQIDGIVLYPNQVFSFWETIQQPSRQNGYLLSRNIVAGALQEDYGGGLCQLSSIIYHQSLKAGAAIIERYNHSVDIYKEEERFTPLGADATVVFGYKDLRIRNCFQQPIKYHSQSKAIFWSVLFQALLK